MMEVKNSKILRMNILTLYMKQGPIIGHRAAQSAEYKILLIYVLGDNIDYRGRPAYAGRPKKPRWSQMSN